MVATPSEISTMTFDMPDTISKEERYRVVEYTRVQFTDEVVAETM